MPRKWNIEMRYVLAIIVLSLAFSAQALRAQLSMGGMGSMMSGMSSLMGMRGGGMSSMLGGRGMMGGMYPIVYSEPVLNPNEDPYKTFVELGLVTSSYGYAIRPDAMMSMMSRMFGDFFLLFHN